jgi:1,4-dihydroxy-2-naphthoyl-CoA hydrolase
MPIPNDGSVDPARLQKMVDKPHRFYRLLGAKIVYVSRDLLVSELPVREELTNPGGNMHGGAVMGMADHLGGAATILNLPPGLRTTTIESKTNFFAPIMEGDVARAECTPLHRGRTTMVWQTRITRGDGKLAALVTQTQMVIKKPE